MNMAKGGKYSFWVPVGLNKGQVKKLIGEIFGVHVRRVATMNFKSTQKVDLWRRKKISPARKKAVVILGPKEKIDIFGEEAKKKK